MNGDGQRDIPRAVRAEVLGRDNGCCRVCGRFTDMPALHHVVFRSHGGKHEVGNLVVVGWTPGHDCHLRFAHGPGASQFRELLLLAVEHNTTALAMARWLGVTTSTVPGGQAGRRRG